jgi:hypothetical protein
MKACIMSARPLVALALFQHSNHLYTKKGAQVQPAGSHTMMKPTLFDDQRMEGNAIALSFGVFLSLAAPKTLFAKAAIFMGFVAFAAVFSAFTYWMDMRSYRSSLPGSLQYDIDLLSACQSILSKFEQIAVDNLINTAQLNESLVGSTDGLKLILANIGFIGNAIAWRDQPGYVQIGRARLSRTESVPYVFAFTKGELEEYINTLEAECANLKAEMSELPEHGTLAAI